MSLGWTRRPVALAVHGLAAWRLAHLVTVEELQPVRAWREWARLRLEASHQRTLHRIAARRPLTIPEQVSRSPLEPLTSCPICAGFWAAVFVVAAASTPRVATVWRPAAVALALSMLPVLPSVLSPKE